MTKGSSQRCGKGEARISARLTEGAIGSTLLRLSLPMIGGLLGIVAFNLVDTFFVGRLGPLRLAAMGFTFPVVLVVNSVALGLGTGAAAVISRAIGEGDQARVKRLTTDSLTLSATIVVSIVAIGLLTIEPLFRGLGATSDTLTFVRSYMRIWYVGAAFVVIPMVGNNAIRATGDTKTPSLIMLMSIAINTALDPLLIFGIGPFPRLEIAGAALATVLARGTSLVVALWVLARRYRMLAPLKSSVRALLSDWGAILHVGIPTTASRVIIPLAMGAATRIVSAYGPTAVAAFGVGTRVEAFALIVVMALAAVLAPFVGQNWGAGKGSRVSTGIGFTKRISLAWGAIVFVILSLLARPLASVFNDNVSVVETATSYLRIVPIGYGFYGIVILVAAALNILRKPMLAAGLSIGHMFLLYVPLALLGSHLFGIQGLFGGIALASIIAGIAAHFISQPIVEYVLEQ